MDTTLRRALREFVDEFDGLFRTLIKNLTSTRGEVWSTEFKKFLRGEQCWTKPQRGSKAGLEFRLVQCKLCYSLSEALEKIALEDLSHPWIAAGIGEMLKYDKKYPRSKTEFIILAIGENIEGIPDERLVMYYNSHRPGWIIQSMSLESSYTEDCLYLAYRIKQ